MNRSPSVFPGFMIAGAQVPRLLDCLEQRNTLADVLLDQKCVPGVQELPESELVSVASSKRYAAFDERAVFPGPEAEGEGISVGRSLCSPTR